MSALLLCNKTSRGRRWYMPAHLYIAGFGFLRLPVAREIVECPVLHERSEGEYEADGDKEIHGRHIRHFGEGFPGYGAEGRHG